MRLTARGAPALVVQGLLIGAAAALAAFFTFAAPGPAPFVAHFQPATLGDQPRGAVVLAREDGDLAVGVAVAPRGDHLLLVATVFGPSGSGVGGLRTSFAVTAGGRTLRAAGAACSAGCYEAAVTAAARPLTASVRLGRRKPVVFVLPRQWPAPPALALVRDAAAEYGQLRSLVTRERLASDPTDAVSTTYYAVAPDKLRFQVRGGVESIIIGDKRWDRQPASRWQESPQAPIRPITPYWTPLVQDATVIGSATVGGRACWVIAFADPQTPGFFTIWLDKADHRTLELEMTAAGHFMHHSYGPFDATVVVAPPAGAEPRT
jgi:hypothetical protein